MWQLQNLGVFKFVHRAVMRKIAAFTLGIRIDLTIKILFMENTAALVKQPAQPLQENTTSEIPAQGITQTGHSTPKDPFHQLEGFQLFAYFTANIIKEEVPFTR